MPTSQIIFCPPQFLIISVETISPESHGCRNHTSRGATCEKWPNVVETSELDRQNCKNL